MNKHPTVDKGRSISVQQAAAADAGHVGIRPTGGVALWPARLSAGVRLEPIV